MKDGGPAFPQTIDDMGTLRSVTAGMTLRDYFAAKALCGYRANSELDQNANAEAIAQWSYNDADAMLVARNKTD